MNVAEAGELLALCSRMDGRTLPEGAAQAWAMLLDDIPAEDAADAVREHYRADRRWIMPADIVAHHERLEQARAVEAARQSPPPCRACGLAYELSDRPGSRFALPVGRHDETCPNAWLIGVAIFDADAASWNILNVEPAEFSEEAYERAHPPLSPARLREIEEQYDRTGWRALE